jgi:hypothetical protein
MVIFNRFSVSWPAAVPGRTKAILGKLYPFFVEAPDFSRRKRRFSVAGKPDLALSRALTLGASQR